MREGAAQALTAPAPSPVHGERRFPAGFTWGVATSAFQIEGATQEDGRGESIWDRFCTVPGAIADGTDGKVACDHYHRWRQDVDLLGTLGVGAYRFSIAWPRVLPAGTGAVNQRGLDFYDRLVDALLDHGVRPFATLYHWDLPQALQDQGGWTSRQTVEAFEAYAHAVATRLGDRVHDWMTHNEPWCAAVLGHADGHHAPGLKDPTRALEAAHHLLLSHGRAVPVLRAASPGARVGIVLNLTPCFPASFSEADRAAAHQVDGELNRWYLDPLHGRGYPEDVLASAQVQGIGGGFAFVHDGDLPTIATPTDFLGVNYYTRAIIRSRTVPESLNEPRLVPEPPASGLTDMGWEVYPDGLHSLLLRVHRDYAPRHLLVTENGAAYAHGPGSDGEVEDGPRQVFLEGHLRACHQALQEGVPLRGYFAWSLIDNFEWAHGYRKRFGLVHVDYPTQRRTVKQSGRWFASVARANALREGGTS